MAIKVPALLHKMSKSAQKAWYKKQGMEMPDEPVGRSAAAAKKVKVAPRKMVSVEPGSVRALNAARQQAYMAKGGRQPIGAMGSGGSNVMAGAGQSTIKDLKASIKAGFNPKVSLDPYESERAKKTGPRSLKLKKESVNEANKPDASMVMTDQLKKKMISDKDKNTLGKIANLMANAKNKDKKNAYVRQVGLKAMKAGKVDPARGHSPTRFGREMLKKEEVEQLDEVGNTQKGVERLKKYIASDRSKVKFSDVAAAKKSENPEKAIEKLAKRQGYKARAMKKIRDFGAVKTPYKPKELHQIVYPSDMKYHGDSVELNGPAINEVTKKEAEAALGGPVKEKPKMSPGKQPAGYRYVRGLARKAMKAGMKKEEVEQVEEGKIAKALAVGAMSLASMGAKAHTDTTKSVAQLAKERPALAQRLQDIGATGQVPASDKRAAELQRKQDQEMPASERRAKELEKMRKEELQYVEEKLSASDPASKWISDFVASDNPKFAGKSKKERIQQALGAYYAAKRGKNEDFEIEESKKMEKMEKRRQMAIAAKLGAEREAGMREEVEQVDEQSPAGSLDDIEDTKQFKDAIALAKSQKAIRQAKDGKDAKYYADGTKVTPAEVARRAAERKAKKQGVAEEVEQVDEMDKSQPSSSRGAEGLALGKKADPVKTDKVKSDALKLLQKQYKKVKEEVGGKTPETKTEVELAKKHGDPKKITYGDVIKARIASAKKKALNKGE